MTKLTDAQRRALATILAAGGHMTHAERVLTKIHGKTVNVLLTLGLLVKTDPGKGVRITDAGKAALERREPISGEYPW